MLLLWCYNYCYSQFTKFSLNVGQFGIKHQTNVQVKITITYNNNIPAYLFQIITKELMFYLGLFTQIK